MRKLKLDLGELRVESFQVAPEHGRRQGTVHGAIKQQMHTIPADDSYYDCGGGGGTGAWCPPGGSGMESCGCPGDYTMQYTVCGPTCGEYSCAIDCVPYTGFETCGASCGCTVGGDVQCA